MSPSHGREQDWPESFFTLTDKKELSMSYSLAAPCWNCAKKEKCTDHVKLQAAINDIHQDCLSSEGGHMGAGMVVLQCVRIDAKDK